MKTISLTQGKFSRVSNSDFEWINQWKWYYRDGYAVRKVWKDGKTKTIYMHIQIMNPPAGMEVDHRDNVGIHNERENLRICTHAENTRNVGIRSHNTSGYKGVTWHKRLKKWMGQIGTGKDKIYLGYFENPKDGAIAYDVAAKRLHGEFARLNFPDD